MTGFELRNAIRLCSEAKDKEQAHILADTLLTNFLWEVAEGRDDYNFVKEAITIFQTMEKWYS